MALLNAAIELGWNDYLDGRSAEELLGRDIVPYGEPLYRAVVADALERALIEPELSWVAELPFDLRRREIQFPDLAAAIDRPAFIKPADDKCFPARV